MKVISIAGLGWIPIAALVAWWTGFAPFPSRPVYARYDEVGSCLDVQCGHPPRALTYNSNFRLLSEPDAQLNTSCQSKDLLAGAGVPGVSASWQVTCPKQNDIPLYGHAARWVVHSLEHCESAETDRNNGNAMCVSYVAAYATYAACMYKKPADVGGPGWVLYFCSSVDELQRKTATRKGAS